MNMVSKLKSGETINCCCCIPSKVGMILISASELILGVYLLIGITTHRRYLLDHQGEIDHILTFHTFFYPAILSLISFMFGIVVACNKDKDLKLELGFFIPYVIITGAWCLCGLIVITAFIEVEIHGIAIFENANYNYDAVTRRVIAVIGVFAVILRIYFNVKIYKFINQANIDTNIVDYKTKNFSDIYRSNRSKNNINNKNPNDTLTMSPQINIRKSMDEKSGKRLNKLPQRITDGNITIKSVGNMKSMIMTKGNELNSTNKRLSDELFGELVGEGIDDTITITTTTITKTDT